MLNFTKVLSSFRTMHRNLLYYIFFLFSVPSAPTSVSFIQLSDAIRVRWAPPVNTNGVITGYSLKWVDSDTKKAVGSTQV